MASKKQEVAVVNKSLPSYMQGYQGPTGAEDIDADDITIPRVKIGQGLSPEVVDGRVNIGDLYLNVTGQRLAEAGTDLRIVIIARTKEFILWQDRLFDGGGILARAKRVQTDDGIRYIWDKPNQTFTNKIKGILPVTWNTLKYVDENKMDKFGSADVSNPDSHPAATAHHNYVVVLPDFGNMVAAMSLSNSQVKKAKDLNFMLNSGEAPIYVREFLVRTIEETSKDGNDYRNLRFVPNEFVSEDLAKRTKALFEQFASLSYTIDQSDGDDGTTTPTQGGKF